MMEERKIMETKERRCSEQSRWKILFEQDQVGRRMMNSMLGDTE